jgi:5-methylcytosine-specific restriction endonuclease McrA
MHAFELRDRSNRQLLAGVKNLVGQECNTTAHLIAHVGEIEARGLHLEEGCPSMFTYCTEVLHLSESVAYRRIDAARIAREYPVIFEKLAEGSVNLTTVLILGPCLTPENHRDLLEAAQHKSKAEVERLAVTMRPRPDVPSVIRKLPSSAGSDAGSAGSESGLLGLDGLGVGVATAPLPETPLAPPQEPMAGAAAAPVRPVPSQRPVVSPLSPERYKIQFTASEETHRKLRQLQELLRHQVPNGDIAVIIDRGLSLLLDQVKREKLAQVKRPRKKSVKVSGVGVEAAATKNGRHIPADVKREVWKRDGGQCAFVSKGGRRCSERGRLEFHHVEPYAMGGPATTENISLRCRAHNAHEGELVFGARVRKSRVDGAGVRVMGNEGVANGTRRALDVVHGAQRNELAPERVSSNHRTGNAGLR